jgi:hypothetical protein
MHQLISWEADLHQMKHEGWIAHIAVLQGWKIQFLLLNISTFQPKLAPFGGRMPHWMKSAWIYSLLILG